MSGKYFLSLAIFLCFVCDVFATSAQNCGIGESEFKAHIAGGTLSPRGKWPWLVALIYRKFDRFFCGGSLISAKHVLSAAHCFQGKLNPKILSPHQVKVLVGKYNLTDKSESGSKSHLVHEIVIHPDWKYEQDNFDADIAILTLDVAAEFNSFVRPVCLPASSNDVVVGIGTVVGWGVTENSTGFYEPTPSELQEPVIDGNTCYTIVHRLGRYSSPQMFCGGFVNQSKATCSGDSGGGFYFPDERSIWTIRGIVSGGLKTPSGRCEVNAYTLFTNTAKYRNWITDIMHRTIDWVKVKFICEPRLGRGVYLLNACELNVDEQATAGSMFSATFSRNRSETVGAIKQVTIDFTPSDHVLPGVGEEFPNVEYFRIEGKSVKFVERRDFANMSQLVLLALHDMPIDFLTDDLLNDLPNLEGIYMESCEIDKIPEKLFANQRELKTLSLEGNSITVLEKDLLKFNLKLETVHLRMNNLKHIFVDFTKLTAITRIELQGNDCISQAIYNRNRIEPFQNTVTSCCGATAPERPSDKSNNRLCFPYGF